MTADSGFDIESMMRNAKHFLNQAQEDLKKIIVSGESGAGMVTVTMNAEREVLSMTIEDDLLKESKEVLIDLICSAVNDGVQKVKRAIVGGGSHSNL